MREKWPLSRNNQESGAVMKRLYTIPRATYREGARPAKGFIGRSLDLVLGACYLRNQSRAPPVADSPRFADLRFTLRWTGEDDRSSIQANPIQCHVGVA